MVLEKKKNSKCDELVHKTVINVNFTHRICGNCLEWQLRHLETVLQDVQCTISIHNLVEAEETDVRMH